MSIWESLETQYKALQRELHPDRYVNASDAQRRWSLQATSLINEAYQTLKSPLLRATYLLKLNGIDLQADTDTRMSNEFLMRQMMLREQLDDVKAANDSYAAAAELKQQIRLLGNELQHGFVSAMESQDLGAARERVREWQFIEKLQQNVRDLEAELDDAQY